MKDEGGFLRAELGTVDFLHDSRERGLVVEGSQELNPPNKVVPGGLDGAVDGKRGSLVLRRCSVLG
eukprot:1874616-Heterocapsa_arctica.AAC.1